MHDRRPHLEAVIRIRLQNHRDARTDQTSVLEVVIAGVFRAVTDLKLWSDLPVVHRVQGADITAAITHGDQRIAVGAEVALHRVGNACLVRVCRRLVADVRARDEPRREVTLSESPSHSPVTGRTGRFERDVGHTTRRESVQ